LQALSSLYPPVAAAAAAAAVFLQCRVCSLSGRDG
jgi:hypothetical protein